MLNLALNVFAYERFRVDSGLGVPEKLFTLV
jgi:hypothetical protein